MNSEKAKKKSPINSTSKRKKKLAIFKRDKGICQICKWPVSFEDCTLDHWPIKRRDGGSYALSNLRLAHSSCNLEIETDQWAVLEERLDAMNLTEQELRFLVQYAFHRHPDSTIAALKRIEERRKSD